MEEWSVFVFGVGECGKSVALDLLKQKTENSPSDKKVIIAKKTKKSRIIIKKEEQGKNKIVLEKNMKKIKNWMFCITDSAERDIEEYMKEKEIPHGRVKSSYIYFRMEYSSPRGFGGWWIAAKRDTEEKIDEYYNQFKDSLGARFSCFVTVNGGGGGTGCGAAPTFAKKVQDAVLEKKESKHSLDLFLAMLILPYRNEEIWRSANAFSCLMRYGNVVDGVLLVDNDRFTDLKKEEINRKVVGMWDTLTESGESTKEWESSDLKRILPRGEIDFNAGIIVPCYEEYEPQILQSGINLKGLVLRTLVEGSFAEMDFTKDFRDTFLMVTLPESLNEFDLGETKEDLAEYTKKNFPLKKKPSVVCKRKGKKIKVVILVVDPYIPRLEELYVLFRNYVSDEKKLRRDINKFLNNPKTEDIERDLKEFWEIMEFTKNNVEGSVLDFNKWLIEAPPKITWAI